MFFEGFFFFFWLDVIPSFAENSCNKQKYNTKSAAKGKSKLYGYGYIVFISTTVCI